MKISVVTSIEQIDSLKEHWRTVCDRDPSATVFQSWGWIRGWINAVHLEDSGTLGWIVLTVQHRQDRDYIGFLPLGTQRITLADGRATRKLFFGGSPWSDNTGLIIVYRDADMVISALAGFIAKELEWDVIELLNVADSRVCSFVEYLDRGRFNVKERKDTVCPYVPLPETWQQYMTEYLGASARNNLNYYTRKVKRLSQFREESVGPKNLASHIETLLQLWMARWGLTTQSIFMGFKTEYALNVFRSVFRHCFEDDSLYLTIFKDGTEPIAGEAAFVDRKMKTIYSYTIAYNTKYAKYSPGNVMTGHVIRYAIENGFRTFDFGAGDEHYKKLFGAVERCNSNIQASRKNVLADFKKHIPQAVRNIKRKLNILQDE